MIRGTGTVPDPAPELPFPLAPEPAESRTAGGSFRWTAAALLGGAGFFVNLAPIQLSPGTDMVFGGIAALLAAVALGPLPGLLASAIAASRTVWLWGHPWGWLVFSLEGYVVGLLVRRRATRPMVADLLFWIFVGSPLVYLASAFALRLDAVAFGVLILKQTVNGVFNAVLVELLLLLPFLRWAMRIAGAPRLQSAIAVIVTTAAILPALIFGIWVGRREWRENLVRAEERVVVYSQAYASQLEQFVVLHEGAVRGAAEASLRQGFFDPEQLQRTVAVTREQFPAFAALNALDSRGQRVAVAPASSASDAPIIDGGERHTSYRERLRKGRTEVVTDVFPNRVEGRPPVIVIGYPLHFADTVAGYMLGALDGGALPDPIRLPEAYERLQVTNGAGAMILDSRSRRSPDAPRATAADTAAFGAVTAAGAPGIAHLSVPGRGGIQIPQTPQVLAGVARIPGLGWWVWLEQPFERIRMSIAESYFRLFGLLISVSLLALLVSTALARYVSDPLLRLRSAAGALAAGDLLARVGRLPAAMPKEIRELGSGFDDMAGALTGRTEELEELGDIARSLASTLDLRTLLPRITEAAERLVDPDGCGIALVTDAGTRLRSADYTLGILADAAGEEIDMDASVPGWVTRSGRSLLIRETRGDSRVGTSYIEAERVRSVISAPLMGRSGVLGALTAVRARSSSRVFHGADLRLLERLAESAAIAVENARLVEAAEAASLAKSAFIATMSHELRTPLNGVLGNLELLEIGIYGELTRKQHETIGRMQAATQQLREVIEEVLSFSRLESGRIEVQLVEVDLCEIVSEVAAMIAPLAQEKGLDFATECETEATLLTDPDKVRQILLDLAGNAVKFTETGGVSLRLELGERQALLSVADTGVGIAPENRRRLFQPFEQLDTGLSRQHGGAGLGLYLAGRYAELVGGRIEVQSEQGVGSRFTLVLPFQQMGVREMERRAGGLDTLAPLAPPHG